MKLRILVIIFFFLFIGLAITANLLFRDALRDNLVVPLLYAGEFLKRVWSSLQPDFIWGLFIFITYLLVLGSLPSLIQPSVNPTERISFTPSKGRLNFWQNELSQIAAQPRLNKYTVLELKKLVLNAVAFRNQSSLHQAEEWIKANSHKIPRTVTLLINPDPSSKNQSDEDEPGNFTESALPNTSRPNPAVWSFFERFKAWLFRYPSLPQEKSQLNIEEIIHFIESYLEVAHDPHNR
jgi:hypothetical protein